MESLSKVVTTAANNTAVGQGAVTEPVDHKPTQVTLQVDETIFSNTKMPGRRAILFLDSRSNGVGDSQPELDAMQRGALQVTQEVMEGAGFNLMVVAGHIEPMLAPPSPAPTSSGVPTQPSSETIPVTHTVPTKPVVDESTYCAYFEAVKRGDVDGIKDGWAAGIDPEAVEYTSGRTGIFFVAASGNLDGVNAFLEKNANVNAKDCGDKPWTPVMYAAQNDHLDVVLRLVERGASPREALEKALRTNYVRPKIVAALLSKVDLKKIKGDTLDSMMHKVGEDPTALSYLESQGGSPDVVSQIRRIRLMSDLGDAVGKNQIERVREMASRVSQNDLQEPWIAGKAKTPEMIQFMINRGVSPENLLRLGVRAGNLELVKSMSDRLGEKTMNAGLGTEALNKAKMMRLGSIVNYLEPRYATMSSRLGDWLASWFRNRPSY